MRISPRTASFLRHCNSPTTETMYPSNDTPQTANPALLRRSSHQNPREPNQANAPCPPDVVQGDELCIDSYDPDNAPHNTAFPGWGPSLVAHAHPHPVQSFIQGQNPLATVPITQPFGLYANQFESFADQANVAGNEASYYRPHPTYNSSGGYPQPAHFLPSHGAEWYGSVSYGSNAMHAGKHIRSCFAVSHSQ